MSQFQQKSQKPSSALLPGKEDSILLASKRRNNENFTLQVSSTSSDDSKSSDISRLNSPWKNELHSASEALRSQFPNSIQISKSQIAPPIQPRNPINWTTKNLERKRINFLRGLEQNQDLVENAFIDEYQQNGKIVVKLQCQDFMTFMRWQHEVEELKRKKSNYDQQKENHQRLTHGDAFEKMEMKEKEKIQIQKQKRYTDSWIVGVSLAKRFLRLGKKKQAIPQPNIISQVQQRTMTLMIPNSDQRRSRLQTLIIPKKKWVALNESLRQEDSQSISSAQD